jgi:hypothetical protein
MDHILRHSPVCVNVLIQRLNEVTAMAPLRERIGRRWRVAAAVAFLAVTIFGALSQGGFLVPKFYASGGGVSGGSIFNTLQNVSWRSWTVTGIQLADKRAESSLRDVKIVRLSLYNESQFPYSEPPVHRLTVGPSQTFSVDLVEKITGCSPPPPVTTVAAMDRYLSSPKNHPHDIPAVVTVSTPLGTRTIGTTFSFSCSV